MLLEAVLSSFGSTDFSLLTIKEAWVTQDSAEIKLDTFGWIQLDELKCLRI